MPANDDTIAARPLPRKPDTGLQAWLSTIGYIAAEYSPDATLIVRIAPVETGIGWLASAGWGTVTEFVSWLPSLPDALRELWKAVERSHRIFKTMEAATRRPANYPDHLWVEPLTAETLERLIAVSAWAFGSEWSLMFIYRPVEAADERVTARLAGRDTEVQIGGRGASFLAAAIDLYRNAAPGYFAEAGRQYTEFFTRF